MEREMLLTATNVQVHSYIPHDIAFSILSKLSLKSFKRFQSVCKSWSLLFDDPYFMNIYRKSFLAKDSSYYDDKSLLLHLLGEDFHHHLFSLSGEWFVKLKLLKPPFYRNHFEILGSVSINGVLCLRVKSIYNEGKIVILWNPTTEEYKQVPSSLSESISIGRNDGFVDYIIGYDRVKDDYKKNRMHALQVGCLCNIENIAIHLNFQFHKAPYQDPISAILHLGFEITAMILGKGSVKFPDLNHYVFQKLMRFPFPKNRK
ncbi:hypothetical protein KIW84_020110 [Lathyrus oleraceus]|uniref:F-box domain-containing protein n=1 Tax=Pisum sativum TaxID=3888 RepID=A0A9D4Y4H3_PEA|nr:hypothetical protein KIW84_020110 [Pisum sativum]